MRAGSIAARRAGYGLTAVQTSTSMTMRVAPERVCQDHVGVEKVPSASLWARYYRVVSWLDSVVMLSRVIAQLSKSEVRSRSCTEHREPEEDSSQRASPWTWPDELSRRASV